MAYLEGHSDISLQTTGSDSGQYEAKEPGAVGLRLALHYNRLVGKKESLLIAPFLVAAFKTGTEELTLAGPHGSSIEIGYHRVAWGLIVGWRLATLPWSKKE